MTEQPRWADDMRAAGAQFDAGQVAEATAGMRALYEDAAVPVSARAVCAVNLGVMSRAAQDHHQALSWFDAAVTLGDPESGALARLYRAGALSALGRWSEALAGYEELAADPAAAAQHESATHGVAVLRGMWP